MIPKQTTALRKIASLRKKIRGVQGGQGSSKTFSILMLIINHASSQPNKEIIIASAELTKMRLTVIKDFVKIMKGWNLFDPEAWKAGTFYQFPNGSFVKFIGLDKDDVGKGLRSDVVYFNEVNKIDVETYRQLASRSKLVYVDFNPDVEFWFHKDVAPREDCDLIITTFEDNEHLPSGEREEILIYKELGYNSDGSIKSKYWANKWRVYGCGLIGLVDGRVLEDWEEVNKIPEDARLEFYGCDFGFSKSKSAVIAVYKFEGDYYIKQLVYETKLTNQQLAEKMEEAGYTGGVVYCDYAEPKSIKELQEEGIDAVKCDNKKDIKDFAIQRLNTKTFYIEKGSTDLIEEATELVYDPKTNKPKKSDKDHAMDALFYAVGSEGRFTGNY